MPLYSRVRLTILVYIETAAQLRYSEYSNTSHCSSVMKIHVPESGFASTAGLCKYFIFLTNDQDERTEGSFEKETCARIL